MNSQDSGKNKSSEMFSPFWPLFIVFGTFAILQLLELRASLQRRSQISNAHMEISANLPKAATIEKTVENVGRDLIALSDGKTNQAAQIISEFQIRINTPPPPAAK